ncbi:MAG: DUF3592 domain-containing protein [Aeromicrobium sp.]
MKQRTRTVVVTGVMAVVVAAFTTAGVVALRGGLEERRNARALDEPSSVMEPATATVTSATGLTEWTEMPVRFATATGTRVQTMVWVRHPRVRFDAGDAVDVEYVAAHPEAARLVGQDAGPARYWRTILTGAGITAGMGLLIVAWIWDLVVGRRRRARA